VERKRGKKGKERKKMQLADKKTVDKVGVSINHSLFFFESKLRLPRSIKERERELARALAKRPRERERASSSDHPRR